MNLIRGAVLRGELDTAPVDLRRWVEMGRPDMDPPYHDYRDWWVPHIDSAQTLWHNMPEMDAEIVRYPTQMGYNTDEYFRETSGESGQMDTDDEMNDERSGSEVGGQQVHNNWTGEVQEGESDNDDWSRPPPISTMGPEWFYE